MLGPPNSPSPSAALMMFSGSSLADETPLLNSLVRVGQGRLTLGHLSVCGAAAEFGNRAHGWLWQKVPMSVLCFWFTKLMGGLCLSDDMMPFSELRGPGSRHHGGGHFFSPFPGSSGRRCCHSSQQGSPRTPCSPVPSLSPALLLQLTLAPTLLLPS